MKGKRKKEAINQTAHQSTKHQTFGVNHSYNINIACLFYWGFKSSSRDLALSLIALYVYTAPIMSEFIKLWLILCDKDGCGHRLFILKIYETRKMKYLITFTLLCVIRKCAI